MLQAADATATDIRTGAAVLMAALTCSGTSHIRNYSQLARGYDRLPEKLAHLGAQLELRADPHAKALG